MFVVANRFRLALGWPDGRLLAHTVVVLFLSHTVTGEETVAETFGPRNNLPRPRVFHVVQELPVFQGGNTNRFRRGEYGEVVLNCGGEADIATRDGGKTWERYLGARLWPSGWFGPFGARHGRSAVARWSNSGDEWIQRRDLGRVGSPVMCGETK